MCVTVTVFSRYVGLSPRMFFFIHGHMQICVCRCVLVCVWVRMCVSECACAIPPAGTIITARAHSRQPSPGGPWLRPAWRDAAWLSVEPGCLPPPPTCTHTCGINMNAWIQRCMHTGRNIHTDAWHKVRARKQAKLQKHTLLLKCRSSYLAKRCIKIKTETTSGSLQLTGTFGVPVQAILQ